MNETIVQQPSRIMNGKYFKRAEAKQAIPAPIIFNSKYVKPSFLIKSRRWRK